MKTYRTFLFNKKPPWADVPAAPIDVFQWEDEKKYRPRCFAKMCFVKNEGVYVLLMCGEKNPMSVYAETDEPVYKDSCLEVFLSLGAEGYINIETNSLGAYLSEFGEKRENRRYLKELTKEKPIVTPLKDKEMWGNEIFLSEKLLCDIYSSFNGVCSGIFRGNFYKCGDETDAVHYGSFSPMGSFSLGFHNPDFFAKIIVDEV